MSMYRNPEQHVANPPASWTLAKVASKRWAVVDAQGTVMAAAQTKTAARELQLGRLSAQWDQEMRWYAGETPPGQKSWAQCEAERPVVPHARSSKRESFLADVLVTALEGGTRGWGAVNDYRWYDPDLEGGTAPPAPYGGGNVLATLHEWDDEADKWAAEGKPVTLETAARGFAILRRGQLASLHHTYRARLLRAYNEYDAGEIDSYDAAALLQVGLYGEVVYG